MTVNKIDQVVAKESPPVTVVIDEKTAVNQEGNHKVVSVSVYKRIQRCKWLGKSKSATARELKLARGTVRKFWTMSESDYEEFCKEAAYRRRRLEMYREEIIEILELNAADGHGVYVSSIYDVLEERHGKVTGNQRTLGNYIRMLRETGAVEEKAGGRVRRPREEVEAGKQCQFDFGELRISSGAKVYVLVAVLAFSRSRYVQVQGLVQP